MPEGDSVRRLADRMQVRTAGCGIVGTDIRWPSCATASFTGASIIEWATHGKHLLTRFNDGRTLHTHLGMDGSWNVIGEGKRLPRRIEPTVRVVFRLADRRTAVATSLRNVDVLPTSQEDLVIGHLGPDLLGDIDLDAAVARVRREPERPAVDALLDQRGVAGLGNAWVVELLYLRGIHPDRPIGEVDVAGALRLAQRMMRHSVEHRSGQTTTGDLRNGKKHWVYGRKGRPCHRCSTTIEFRDGASAVTARATWWCPYCQPASKLPAG